MESPASVAMCASHHDKTTWNRFGLSPYKYYFHSLNNVAVKTRGCLKFYSAEDLPSMIPPSVTSTSTVMVGTSSSGRNIMCIDHTMWRYSKNPCLCRNCTFPKEVHNMGLGSMRLKALCFAGSDDAPSWEMCNFHMVMCSCFYPMTCKKHQCSHPEIAHFHTPISCTNCVG